MSYKSLTLTPLIPSVSQINSFKLSEWKKPSILWFYNPVISNLWKSIPPPGCVLWLWTSFDHCPINLTLTATIYNCSGFLPIIVVPLQVQKTAAQGKSERMQCLVKTWKGNGGWGGGGKNFLEEKTKGLIMNNASFSAVNTGDLACSPQQSSE